MKALKNFCGKFISFIKKRPAVFITAALVCYFGAPYLFAGEGAKDASDGIIPAESVSSAAFS